MENLLVTLLGTLVGVFLAFRLDRIWESRQSKQRYALLLDACTYDLASLRSRCRKIGEQISVGATNVLDVEVPTVHAFLTNPILYEHGGHGLILALTALASLTATTQNVMQHYRYAAAVGRGITETGVIDTRNRMNQLVPLIEFVQFLIEKELQVKLRLGVLLPPEDKEIVERLNQVLRGQ